LNPRAILDDGRADFGGPRDKVHWASALLESISLADAFLP